ncbi:MAG: BatD family protein [Odoribacteraceae bacterium]|jgi:hypothetical protein|nr:BatD family protein [Odoribacteraceae bacterium]
MRLFFLLLLFITGSVRGIAQEVSFTATAPKVVEIGEQFKLVFSLNRRGEDLKIAIPDEFTLLAGPSPAMESQTILDSNGKMTSSTTYTYTYVLDAAKEGTFTVESATIRVGGKEYTSNKLTIKVVKGEANTNARQQRSRSREYEEPQQGSATVTEEDLFLRWEIGRSSLYLGESFVATLKVYTRTNLSGFGRYKAPSFAGFLTEEIPVDKISFERVEFNGRVYEAGIVAQWVLSPQHTGELTIDPFELDCRVLQRVVGSSPLDHFFGSSVRTVNLPQRSRPVKVSVKNLPEAGKPSNFNGVVGNLTLSTSISHDTIRANDAFTYTIVFRGNGNLRMLEAPKINLPHDFDVYDPKVTRNVQTQSGITTGTVMFEYVVIPRYAGDYTLPPVNYSYFNILSQNYKTLTGNAFNVHVLKGSDTTSPGTGTTAIQSFKKEDVRVLGEDIHYIKTGSSTFKPKGVRFFRTTAYALSLIVPFVLCVAGMLLNRRRIKARADLVRVKSKTANKMAQKRLKAAAGAMAAGDSGRFYQEVLTAMWGYVSYKLNIPASALNRDNISDHLNRRRASEEMILRFIGVLDQCEYARYAPDSDAGEEMEKLYNEAITTITRLNGQLTDATKK